MTEEIKLFLQKYEDKPDLIRYEVRDCLREEIDKKIFSKFSVDDTGGGYYTRVGPPILLTSAELVEGHYVLTQEERYPGHEESIFGIAHTRKEADKRIYERLKRFVRECTKILNKQAYKKNPYKFVLEDLTEHAHIQIS